VAQLFSLGHLHTHEIIDHNLLGFAWFCFCFQSSQRNATRFDSSFTRRWLYRLACLFIGFVFTEQRWLVVLVRLLLSSGDWWRVYCLINLVFLFSVTLQDLIMTPPNNSPEPTAVGAGCFAHERVGSHFLHFHEKESARFAIATPSQPHHCRPSLLNPAP